MFLPLNKKIKKIIIVIFICLFPFSVSSEESSEEPLDIDWSFQGIFGTFDRASLQRGYQVYQEVCAGCHSMEHLSYRNLYEKGGPEFSKQEAKAIAAQFEIEDGPDAEGEMFFRPGRLSDKFAKPYSNVQAAKASNGGAYPPDMSVLVKARKNGANYIYSLLVGYEDAPAGFEIEEGVYYNKYMAGNKIKMAAPLSDGIIEYTDGTESTTSQMAKDVVAFLVWAGEPHLEARHKTGFKAIIYLIILLILVYLSKKKVWSRFDNKKDPEEDAFDKAEDLVTEYEGEDPKTFK